MQPAIASTATPECISATTTGKNCSTPLANCLNLGQAVGLEQDLGRQPCGAESMSDDTHTHPNARMIETLYRSLSARNPIAAADCYAGEARFDDIAFRLKGKQEILRMWRLVCGADLTVEFDPGSISAHGDAGSGKWVAIYPPVLGKTRPPVRNLTTSEFRFDGGKIVEHHDYCDPKAWARQAFPYPVNLAMGSIPPLRRLLAWIKLQKSIPDSTE